MGASRAAWSQANETPVNARASTLGISCAHAPEHAVRSVAYVQGGAQPRFWWIARRPRRVLSLGEQERGYPCGGMVGLGRVESRALMTNLVRTRQF